MVIGSPMIPNCPADNTCANTKVISALLALDSTWSTVVKIATKPAPLAGVPVEEQVVRLNLLQTSSRANRFGDSPHRSWRLNVEPRGVSSALVITSPSLWKPSQQSWKPSQQSSVGKRGGVQLDAVRRRGADDLARKQGERRSGAALPPARPRLSGVTVSELITGMTAVSTAVAESLRMLSSPGNLNP